jgi:hypothetical protein
MYGVQDEDRDLNTRDWTGAAWNAVGHGEHDTSTEDDQHRNFDIVFESNPSNAGRAWIMWGDGGTTSRSEWTGTAWVGPVTFGDDAGLVQLAAHLNTSAVLAGIYQDANGGTDQITETHNVGSGWTAEATIWVGPTVADPVHERVYIAPRRFRPVLYDWIEIFP